MQIDASLGGKVEDTVEGRQARRIELARLGIERAEGHSGIYLHRQLRSSRATVAPTWATVRTKFE
jgi:hypothetical protein